MNTKEIAEKIDAHLKRFEANPAINVKSSYGLSRFYLPFANASGGWVSVCYVSYQRVSRVKKADAARYLEKLDAGFVGRLYEALREEHA